jgi:predicted  nucleic acid-binding Zn-ribbon protein
MSAKLQVEKYFAALDRLKARGEPINNDSVALEAGSGRGSIKRSRPAYTALIAAIDEASKEQAKVRTATDPAPALRDDVKALTKRLDQSLEREVALLRELYDLRHQVKQLTEDNRQLKMGRLVPVQ